MSTIVKGKDGTDVDADETVTVTLSMTRQEAANLAQLSNCFYWASHGGDFFREFYYEMLKLSGLLAPALQFNNLLLDKNSTPYGKIILKETE